MKNHPWVIFWVKLYELLEKGLKAEVDRSMITNGIKLPFY